MGNRLAQLALLIPALAFLMAGLAAMTEPWAAMPIEAMAQAACAHLISLCLSAILFRLSFYFGARAAYGAYKRIREPQL